jgi:hypothetical protein
MLGLISKDLNKAEKGNKAAAQRVRTGSIKFAKVAKIYRKESIYAKAKAKSAKKSTRKTAKKKTRKTKRK